MRDSKILHKFVSAGDCLNPRPVWQAKLCRRTPGTFESRTARRTDAILPRCWFLQHRHSGTADHCGL